MERWSKTLNTRLARGSAMAWYSVDERLLTIRLTPKIAQPVTRQPSPRRAACTTITTRAATDSAEAMPEVMLLAISSPSVYRLPTTGRAPPHQPNSPRGRGAGLERQPREFPSECIVLAQANVSRTELTKIPTARSSRSIRNFAGGRGGYDMVKYGCL